ncbi:MAG: DUF3105 domain-containing protein [Actinomycetota bacterium]|nr:DUF3105 domain-containing protein [Actinomycetota bacterium]
MARSKGKALERRRQQRAEERAAAQASAARKRKLAWALLALAVLAGVVAFVVTRPPGPGVEETETFPDQGRAHLAPGAPTPAYNSDPPTSGPHGPQPAPCGVHRSEVPDIAQIHSLEHGAVVIQYQPSLPQEEVERLEDLARDLGDYTLVAPREGAPSPVVLTAWTKRLTLDEVDEASIRTFYRRFAGNGPEQALCPFQVDEAGS